jgi:hypothetical protein
MYSLFATRFTTRDWLPGDDPLEVIHLGDYNTFEEASKAQTEACQSGPFALDDRWAFRIISD